MTSLITDPVAMARQTAAWQRDVPPDCRCPHTWHPDTAEWVRSTGASCGVHRDPGSDTRYRP